MGAGAEAENADIAVTGRGEVGAEVFAEGHGRHGSTAAAEERGELDQGRDEHRTMAARWIAPAPRMLASPHGSTFVC